MDPWVGLPPLVDFTALVHRCSTCGMAFLCRPDAEKHVGRPGCCGAAVVSAECDVVCPGRPTNGRRKRQPPSTTVHGNQNNATTVNDHSVHINTLIVVNTTGDVVRAGSALESELIRKTILENATLRRMVRTIENAPSAIFHLTKGANGPQVLRNVKRSGRKACELRDAGAESHGLLMYCKRTAVKMVDELQRAIDLVSDDSPPAVREWAADVSAAMRHKLFGNLDYVAALQLYCDASNKFYKLPDKARQAIAGGVRDIGRFIAETADF